MRWPVWWAHSLHSSPSSNDLRHALNSGADVCGLSASVGPPDTDGSSGGFGGLQFSSSPSRQNVFAMVKVDFGRGEVTDTVVVAVAVAVDDQCGKNGFRIALVEIVSLQDAVLQGLMPSLDLALGLRIHRRATIVFHAPVLKVFSHIRRDEGRTIVI